ncbi:MAG: trypsin-like peptidase domain-containing protein [Bryobacteraceae bacterium]
MGTFVFCRGVGPWRVVALLFLFGLPVLSQVQQDVSAPGRLYTPPKQTPIVRSAPSFSPGPRSVPLLELPALEPDTISQLSEPPHESRVGVNRPLVGFDASSGQWWTNMDGSKVWSLQVRSLGATGVRLHIKNFDVGTGTLWVFDPNQVESAVSFTAKGPHGSGGFWTNTIFAETVQVDFMPEPGASPQLSFLVPELYHWWASHPFPTPGGAPVPVPKSSASGPVLGPPGGDITCFKDASCYISSANPYVQLMSLADVYLVFANQTCSGTLVIDRNATNTPYVLTAGHCVGGQDLTQLESFFKFKTPFCTGQNGAFGDLSSLPFPVGSAYPSVAGATLLASSLKEAPPGSGMIDLSVPDFGFLKLANSPPGVVYYAGWNTSQTGETVYSITHPRNLPQAFTQGTLTGTMEPSFLDFFPSLGLLDNGSSGGGQFNSASQLIAVESSTQRTASPSVYGCTLPVYGDYFTSFSAIYPLIQPWLEDAEPTVTLTASPASVPPGLSVVTLTWNAPGSSSVLIRVGSATGTLFAGGGPSGSATTGNWAAPGMVFYLIDQSTGATLKTLTMQAASVGGAPTLSANPNPLPAGTNVVALSWNAPAYSSALIRVGSPTGTLFAEGGASGTAMTGPWASTGMTFYLINPTTGTTLASLTLQSATAGNPTISASPDSLPAGTNVVTVTWNAPGYSSTLIRVGSSIGTLFASGGPSGAANTGAWASPGLTFFLIDQNSGTTLAQVTL